MNPSHCPSSTLRALRGWVGIGLCAILALLVFSHEATAAPMARSYTGSYVSTGGIGNVSVQAAEALPGQQGYISWTTVGSNTYLGSMVPSANGVDIKWYNPSGSYQIPLGTITGVLSPDGKLLIGFFRHGIQFGICWMQAN